MKTPIYMDHHATTPVDARVLEAMWPYFTEHFGNASSRSHAFGWKALEAVEQARAQVAALIGASPREIIFTSGATESINLALKGAASRRAERGHIIVTAVEHAAVLDTARALERQGHRLTHVPVDRYGVISLEALERAFSPDTFLVSVMWVNNEIGTVQPVSEVARLCLERGVLFHCDATQGVGQLPMEVGTLKVDLLSFSAHKLYGPKGIGALYIRRRNPPIRLIAQLDGGGHERGFRSGTLNVPAIVGFGAACALCGAELEAENLRLTDLRERLWYGLSQRIPSIHLNGHPTQRHPGNLNISFDGISGESLLNALKDIALSSGSACTSSDTGPSHVLRACGLSADQAHTSIRIGLGRQNTIEEAEYVIHRLEEVVGELRSLSPAFIEETRQP